MLEWVAIAFSRESSGPRDQTPVSPLAGRFTDSQRNSAGFSSFVCRSHQRVMHNKLSPSLLLKQCLVYSVSSVSES